MDRVCIYLRKSRADEEAERLGEGETLSKHRQILLKLAADKKFNIVSIKEEIASGESLLNRPAMLELLKEIEEGLYDGVLCMDLDRLGRGNMQEQGLILETFKSSKTKIITPRKIYDLEDEFDEEYSEFEAFMARKELKIINRRLQRGRIKSIEDGNYIATLPPYGYKIIYENNSRILVPNPEQAEIVKLIFNLYTNEKIGCGKIAKKLNQLGYKTYTGKKWSNHSVLNIIKNEIYTGKILWRKTKTIKSKKYYQKREVTKRSPDEWIVVDGKHRGIISENLFNKAQKILRTRSHVPYNKNISNPLAGIIKCGICDSSMVLRNYSNGNPYIVCYKNCGNVSSKFELVEDRLLWGLRNWFESYELKWENMLYDKLLENSDILTYKKAVKNLERELKEVKKQKNSIYDLLEKGVYDEYTFSQRLTAIDNKIEIIKRNINKTKIDIKKMSDNQNKIVQNIPKVSNILDFYYMTSSPKEKNLLLKSLLKKVVYYKDKGQRKDYFKLEVFPRIPIKESR